jgi:hypothetical protein
MWLALVAALGCGFLMAYSLMFIAAALFFSRRRFRPNDRTGRCSSWTGN